MISDFEQEQIPGPSCAFKQPDEIILRVNNLTRMIFFYHNALGFELIGEFSHAALLEITEQNGGYTRAIGLFKAPVRPDHERPAVDRIIISIPLEGWWPKRRRLEQLGFAVHSIDSNRVYTQDPEGNQVELVCRNDITGW